MTDAQLKKATKIDHSLKVIDYLDLIVNHPYTRIFSRFKDNKFGFFDDFNEISFASLDDTTNKELKLAIHEVISRRRDELKEELKNL